MKNTQTIALFIGLFAQLGYSSAQDSLNMTVLSTLDPSSLEYTDIWGYTDGTNEYAIMGSEDEIYFIDVTNPSNPSIVKTFSDSSPGLSLEETYWRDFKTYSHYAYAVADNASEGLLIFDLSALPTDVSLVDQTSSFFSSCHNIFIDENVGKLYAAGTNTRSNGVIVLDVATNPEEPTQLASVPLPGGGIHDLYVREDTAYANSGGNGLYIIDMTNPNSPQAISSTDGGGYNHSCWVSDDRSFLLYAEELPLGRPLAVVLLDDITDIEEDHTFKEPLLAPAHTNNRPHNPFLLDSLAIISYYEDGIQIFDMTDPLAPILVGYYDTHPTNTNYGAWHGCWGVYPYLPSGTIIASDILGGLQVMEFLGSQPLPLDLLEFEVNINNQQAQLSWTTAQEENLSHFLIQRSRNGRQYETIGQLAPKGPGIQEYGFVDAKVPVGQIYYRLRIEDLDGSFSYSPVRTIWIAQKGVSLSHNVFSGNEALSLQFAEAGPASLYLFDQLGRLVYQDEFKVLGPNEAYSFSPRGLSQGQYWLRVDQSGGQILSRSILIH